MERTATQQSIVITTAWPNQDGAILVSAVQSAEPLFDAEVLPAFDLNSMGIGAGEMDEFDFTESDVDFNFWSMPAMVQCPS